MLFSSKFNNLSILYPNIFQIQINRPGPVSTHARELKKKAPASVLYSLSQATLVRGLPFRVRNGFFRNELSFRYGGGECFCNTYRCDYVYLLSYW